MFANTKSGKLQSKIQFLQVEDIKYLLTYTQHEAF
jgi:hypothetical protein